MQSSLPRSNKSTPTQLTLAGAPHSNSSSRTATPPATTTEFIARDSQFDLVGKSQVKARIGKLGTDVGLVTTYAQNLPATPDRPRQKFREIEDSKRVHVDRCDLNDVGGHQIEIILGTNPPFRPGTVSHPPPQRDSPANPTDPSARQVVYTGSRVSKVSDNQIIIQSNDDKLA